MLAKSIVWFNKTIKITVRPIGLLVAIELYILIISGCSFFGFGVDNFASIYSFNKIDLRIEYMFFCFKQPMQ